MRMSNNHELDELDQAIKELELALEELEDDDEDFITTIDSGEKQKHYFTAQFMEGLTTKSEGFQNKFFEIIDDICDYFDDEDEKMDFQKYIEENHSFDKPGNILYSTKTIFCGKHKADEHDELCEKIHHFLLSIFDAGGGEAFLEVPHIIVCISVPDNCLTDKDVGFIRNLISFERVCRGSTPVAVTSIVNDTSNGRGTSCFAAALK